MNLNRIVLLTVLCLNSSLVNAMQPESESLLAHNNLSGRQYGLEFVRGASKNLFADQQQRKALRENLLKTPGVLLFRRNQKILQRLWPNGLEHAAPTIDELSFTSASEENPLFLIRECSAPSCPLNRGRYPNRRDFAEKFIVNNIAAKHPDTSKELTLTFFGPGTMLSELIIATRLLEKGYSSLTFNFIMKDEEKLFLELKQQLEENPKLPFRTETFEGTVVDLKICKFAQFVQWLHTYPGNTRVSVYPDQESYIADCATNNNLASDVCIGIDIQEQPKDFSAPFHFYCLSLSKALKEGGVAYTCSRIAILSDFDQVVQAMHAPPVEVLEKRLTPSDDETRTLGKQVAKLLDKANQDYVPALSRLLLETGENIVAKRYHQPETQRIAAAQKQQPSSYGVNLSDS